MTIGKIRDLCKQWQERLGLRDWNIKVRWSRSGELEEDVLGMANWFTQSTNALIVMRRGEEEHTLVHELLHIRLEGHRGLPVRGGDHYEAAINALTDALIGRRELWFD